MNSLFALCLFFGLQNTNTVIEKKLSYHSQKADLYYHRGDFSNMLYHLIEKVKLDKNDVNAYSDISYYYWSMSIDDAKRKKEFEDKALFYLNLGLKNNENTAFMWDELGNFYIRVDKNYNLAIKYLKTAIQKKDAPLSSFHSLSLCYLKLNKTDDAINTLQQCVVKFPNDAKAKSKLKELMDLKTGS